MAAQLMATNGLRLRGESRCSASATSSLPEPVGPSISTGVERGATRRMRRLTSSMQGALPTNSGRRSFDADCTALPLSNAELRRIGTGNAGMRMGPFSVFTIGVTWGALSRVGAVFQAAESVSWLRRKA